MSIIADFPEKANRIFMAFGFFLLSPQLLSRHPEGRISFLCSPPDKGELEGVLKIMIPNDNPSQPPPSMSSGQALLRGVATPDSGS